MTALILGTILSLSALAYVLAPLFMDLPGRKEVARTSESTGSHQLLNRTCSSCGPRPEGDAIYCSSCGRYLGGPCVKCGMALDQPGARFCAHCGHGVAA